MSRIPDSEKKIFQGYFGGASLLNTSTFQLVNGFSNQYWGWGGEDDDLLQRLRWNFGCPKFKFLYSVADPDFYPSRVPDPRSRILDPKTATKERGENYFLSYLFM
jgi:hypothetical protein